MEMGSRPVTISQEPPFQDTPYCVEDFTRQLDKMKDTSAGFDDWTRAALRLFLVRAWQRRALIENLAKEKGIFHEAYLHVPLPMLPKGHALTPSHHRGITIFSMFHRIVYGVVWHRVKEWQEEWLDEAQQGGRSRGEHQADAWDFKHRSKKLTGQRKASPVLCLTMRSSSVVSIPI